MIVRLSEDYLGGFVALTTDVETTGCGLGHAYALEVEVLYGSVVPGDLDLGNTGSLLRGHQAYHVEVHPEVVFLILIAVGVAQVELEVYLANGGSGELGDVGQVHLVAQIIVGIGGYVDCKDTEAGYGLAIGIYSEVIVSSKE